MLHAKRKTQLQVHYMEELLAILAKAAEKADSANEHMTASRLRVLAVDIEATLDRGINII